jgi:hypothetical protein
MHMDMHDTMHGYARETLAPPRSSNAERKKEGELCHSVQSTPSLGLEEEREYVFVIRRSRRMLYSIVVLLSKECVKSEHQRKSEGVKKRR